MSAAVREARERSFRELDRELFMLGQTVPARQMRLVVKKVVLDGLRKIVRRTPVLTGRARANWQVTFDSPAEDAIEVIDKSGGTTIAAGQATLQALSDAAPRSMPVVWITNNLPYIVALEEGGYPPSPKKGTYIRERRTRSGRRVKAHYEIRSAGGFSRQAPRGMVAVTVEELLAQFPRLSREDGS